MYRGHSLQDVVNSTNNFYSIVVKKLKTGFYSSLDGDTVKSETGAS
jgi:hypothetical protein